MQDFQGTWTHTHKHTHSLSKEVLMHKYMYNTVHAYIRIYTCIYMYM